MSSYDIYLKDNKTIWCDIPSKLKTISDKICQMYKNKNCKRLPCHMIYSSLNTIEDIKCSNHGEKSLMNISDILCKRSYSLDLFLKDSYPSLIADSLTPFSDDLYQNVLNKNYRSCDSIWGFVFNFESITNYPWTSDRDKLKFFDISFGYDRSIYDFIPHPWLFDYIEQIQLKSKRLSIEQVIQMKKRIDLKIKSDIYFINKERKNDSSYVTAPILWMNTNCNTPSKRTEYLNELIKYIDIDNYGNCGKNILNLPKDIIQIQNSKNKNLKERGTYNWLEGKLSLSSKYLFTIAIENSINYDYITEKFWHPFIAGSIPIYLGAPNINDWIHCQTDCFIDLMKFQTHQQAAEYIQLVARNKTLYQSYHQWRNEPLKKDFQNILNYFQRINNYSLDCILCHISNQITQGQNITFIKNKLKQRIGTF